jgi:hypothetical protein
MEFGEALCLDEVLAVCPMLHKCIWIHAILLSSSKNTLHNLLVSFHGIRRFNLPFRWRSLPEVDDLPLMHSLPSKFLHQARSQVADELGAAHYILSSSGDSLFLQHEATDDCYF